MNRIKIWTNIFYSFFKVFFGSKNAVFLDSKKTIEKTTNSRISIVRFGDGEFNLLNGRDVHYQKWSIELENDLKEIIKQYTDEKVKPNYFLCMPKDFLECNSTKLLKKKEYFLSWPIPRRTFIENYDYSSLYGDSFLFAGENQELYKNIWKKTNTEHVVFVHNNSKYGELFQEKYKINTTNVIIPKKDSYEHREEILNDIIKNIKNPSNDLVMVSAGPCAKILVERLSRENIWAIDTGHCWDEPLNLIIK